MGVDLHSESFEDSVGVLANNAGVATNLDLIGLLADGAVHDDDLGVTSGHGRGEGSVRRNGGGGSTSTSGGAAVLASIANGSLYIFC